MRITNRTLGASLMTLLLAQLMVSLFYCHYPPTNDVSRSHHRGYTSSPLSSNSAPHSLPLRPPQQNSTTTTQKAQRICSPPSQLSKYSAPCLTGVSCWRRLGLRLDGGVGRGLMGLGIRFGFAFDVAQLVMGSVM